MIPTSQSAPPVGMNGASLGFDTIDVFITMVADGLAHTVDRFGKERVVAARNTAASGALPRVGETWRISRVGNYWNFSGVIKTKPPTITGDRLGSSALANLLNKLAADGLVDDQTGDSGPTSTIAASGVTFNASGLVVITGFALNVQVALQQVDAALAARALASDLATETANRIAVDATKAQDSTVVHISGTETVGGLKTFTGELVAKDFKPSGLIGATAAGRYVGVTTTGAPTSGTFVTGDWITTQDGHVWVCTAGGTPGTWNDVGAAAVAGVSSFNARTGAVTLLLADVTGVGGAADSVVVHSTGVETVAGVKTFSSEPVAPSFKATGKAGATAQPTIIAGGTASGAPTTGAHVLGELVLDAGGSAWYCTVAGTPGTWVRVNASAGFALDSVVVHNTGNETVAGVKTFSSEVVGLDFKATGLTGATQATRYVGGTSTGAPVSGTFGIGDWVMARDGHIFMCTTAGTPGTWVDMGSYGSGTGAVSSFNTRTGAVTLALADVTGAGGADDSTVVHKTGPETVAGAKTFSSEITAPDFKPSGLTGAVAATRYVGGTATGAPASGTFGLGDFVIAQDGHVWICSVAGTPGTWIDASASGGGGSATDSETLFWMTRLA